MLNLRAEEPDEGRKKKAETLQACMVEDKQRRDAEKERRKQKSQTEEQDMVHVLHVVGIFKAAY